MQSIYEELATAELEGVEWEASSDLRRRALFSSDRRYRYLLWHDLSEELHEPERRVRMLWVMLNPSIAGANVVDPTSLRVWTFSRRFGATEAAIVNLCAFIAPDPSELAWSEAAEGPHNARVIWSAMGLADVVVCAWGCEGRRHGRASAFRTRFADRTLHSIGVLQGGHGEPRHPLYAPRCAKLEPLIRS